MTETVALAFASLQDANGLPPIPEISNAIVRREVFTHASLRDTRVQGVLYVGSNVNPSNESLAQIGDALLKLQVLKLIRERYPTITPGGSTKIVSVMVSNPTLAALSAAYNLHKNLAIPGHQLRLVSSNVKARATVFEAYIAGLDTEELAVPFIRQVFMPAIEEQFRSVSANRAVSNAIDDGHNWVGDVNEWAQRRRYVLREIEYTSFGPDHDKTFDCTMALIAPDGQFRYTGIGSGATKKTAKADACVNLWLQINP